MAHLLRGIGGIAAYPLEDHRDSESNGPRAERRRLPGVRSVSEDGCELKESHRSTGPTESHEANDKA